MMLLRLCLSIFMLMSLSSGQALAYAFYTVDEGGDLIGTTFVSDPSKIVIWQEKRVAFGVALTGLQFQQDAASAFSAWNAAGANISIVQGQASGSACSEGDGLNTINFTTDKCRGLSWGDAIGLTQIQAVTTASGSYLVETDIRLRAFSVEPTNEWATPSDPNIPEDRSCYSPNHLGGMSCDFYRVILHELGHALGLGHPDEHHQRVSAVMNSGATANPSPRRLTQDDINGIKAIYADDREAIDGTAGVAISTGLQRDKVSSGSIGAFTLMMLLGYVLVSMGEGVRKRLLSTKKPECCGH